MFPPSRATSRSEQPGMRVVRFSGRCPPVENPLRPTMTIDGGDAVTRATFTVVNPATEEVIALAPDCTREELDAAVAGAARAFPGWSALGHEKRQRAVLDFARAVERHRDALADLLVLEQGKSRERAIGEINASLAYARAFSQMALDVEILEDSSERRIELHRRPLGPVAAIFPWNYPVLLAFWKLAPALLTGNTVILKPSPLAPLTALRLGEIARGMFPAGVLSVVSGEEAGAWLASHPGIRKVAFTGSIATGKKVMSEASPTLKRLTLELGGNDAGIVLPDFNLAQMAKDLFWAAFSNCGQVCAGLKRLYVPDALYDDVCEALADIANKVIVGDGRCPGVEMGPVQNRAQFQRIEALVAEARAGGAKVICGGAPLAGKGYFYPPTLVRDIADDAALVAEEQFGPVLPLLRYHDVEDALTRANSSRYGLGGSVWGRNIGKAAAIAARLETGTAWVNQHPAMAAHVPFGGVKESGLGVELSQYGLEAYTDMFVLNVKKSD
jgi:acyl-CoA reductase-like NAD-dependent aldehyde dehydrogenase